MKNFGILVVKALFAAVLVILAANFAADKLPAMLVVGGRDLRPFIGGGAVLAVLMYFGKPGAPNVPVAGNIIQPAAA